MAAKKPRFEWNREGLIEILNGPKASEVLDALGEAAVTIAQGVYDAQSKGQEKGPEFYRASFFIRKRFKLARGGAQVQTRQIGNSDDEWRFVEFGLWAGGSGKTPVTYKYRVLGRTLDILESGGGEIL